MKKKDPRKDWDVYFMEIAQKISERATCPRKHVGAVIVRDKIVLSTGYNGSIRGRPHCTDVGCMMEEGHCVRTVHSEANAIIQAAKYGTPIEGATIYVTASPCWYCFKLIVNAGIKRIVFGELYRDERITKFAKECGIETLLLKKQVQQESWKVAQEGWGIIATLAEEKSTYVLEEEDGQKKRKSKANAKSGGKPRKLR